MMSPPTSAANPDASCWTAELKLMKLPRSRASTLPLTSAIAGPKRPGTKMKKNTTMPTTYGTGSRGKCVCRRIGTIEMNARMVKTRRLPKRSASHPITCAVNKVVMPPAK